MFCGEPSSGHRKFSSTAFAHNWRQSLERADVRDDGKVDFLNAKDCFVGRVADITGSDQIDATADAGTIDRCNNRLATSFKRTESLL